MSLLRLYRLQTGFVAPGAGTQLTGKQSCSECGVRLDASLVAADENPPSILFVPAQSNREAPPHQLPGGSAWKRGDHPVRIDLNRDAESTEPA